MLYAPTVRPLPLCIMMHRDLCDAGAKLETLYLLADSTTEGLREAFFKRSLCLMCFCIRGDSGCSYKVGSGCVMMYVDL